MRVNPDHRCAACGVTPEREEFNLRADGRFYAYCRPCNTKNSAEYRKRRAAGAPTKNKKRGPEQLRQPCPLNAVMRHWLLPFSPTAREGDPCSTKILHMPQCG